MRKLLACLGAATLVLLFAARANAQTVLKPYVTLILDTSGSMQDPTNSGPPSCGGTDQKINHATCAIRNIAASYGDIEFAFGRFRNIMSGTTTAGTFPTGCCSHGPGVTAPTDGCPAGPACTTNDDMFEMLNPLLDDLGAGTAKWVNGTGNTCTGAGTDPEIWLADSNTPLEGVLKGVRRYWQGLQATATTIATTNGAKETGTTATYTTTAAHNLTPGEPIDIAGVGVAGYNGRFTVATVPSTTTFTVTGLTAGLAASGGGSVAVEIFVGTPAQGFAPIANDPLKNVFLPGGCDPTPSCTAGTCCTSQCRPYITILLTDGDETCGGSPANGAAAMLTTQVGPDNYRIETKPIGFGIAPPPVANCGTAGQTGCQIEDIAHAGGATNVAGVNEGFYAADEAGLELAISKIIEGAVRSEICNGLDDDCDGSIDEDFPTKGQACGNGLQGACAVAGTLVCRADGGALVCNAGTAACNGKADGTACTVKNTAGTNEAGTCTAGVCNPTPGTEICNGIDDDCDGNIDEGIAGCTCVPQAEICNGKDDDCDGQIDEDTDVPCGVNLGVCTAGVQHCVCSGSNCGLGACTGAQPCGGVTPCVETCNGKDDNCDGVVDGITAACSNLPATGGHPAGDPANNPGDPGQGTPCDAEGTLCACHPGVKVCPAGGSGTFSACAGEAVPTTEICNGIDDDCDGTIDEDFVSAKCGACGVTSCVNGVITCAQGTGSAETCNNKDDDCDGNIDEDVPDGGPCTTAQVCNGVQKCVNGAFQCVGQPVVAESCNCIDDDCDGTVDENNGNCPSGSTCTNSGTACECAFPCGNSEFPCPAGKTCQNNLCISDPCYGVTCGADQNGNATTCVKGVCVNACSVANCTAPDVCVPATGQCAPNNCITFPQMCTAQQSCVAGVCVTNPCSGVTCPSDQYCEGGTCYASCAGVTCPSGQECKLGTCQPDPCGHPCPSPQVCHSDGTCGANNCQFQNCQQGQFCDPADGTCKADPCVGTACPTPDQVCVAGTCYSPSQLQPDAGLEVHVTAAGGGCDTGGAGGAGSLLVALALGAALARRRRADGGAQ